MGELLKAYSAEGKDVLSGEEILNLRKAFNALQLAGSKCRRKWWENPRARSGSEVAMKQQITAITERVDSDKSGFDRADLSKPHTLKELLEEARRETFDTKGAEITEEPGELFGNALLIRKGDEEYSFTESLGVIEASEVFRKAKEKYPAGAAFYKAIEEDAVLATLIDMKGNELTELLKKHAAAEDKAESIEKLRVFSTICKGDHTLPHDSPSQATYGKSDAWLRFAPAMLQPFGFPRCSASLHPHGWRSPNI